MADAALLTIVAKQSERPIDVRHFEGGRAALDYLIEPGAALPDLVLLDLNMPGMSGHEVLDEIRAVPHLDTLPVLIMTSSENESDVDRSYRGHANAYLSKPMGLAGFKELIASVEQFWEMVATLNPPRP